MSIAFSLLMLVRLPIALLLFDTDGAWAEAPMAAAAVAAIPAAPTSSAGGDPSLPTPDVVLPPPRALLRFPALFCVTDPFRGGFARLAPAFTRGDCGGGGGYAHDASLNLAVHSSGVNFGGDGCGCGGGGGPVEGAAVLFVVIGGGGIACPGP